MAKTTKKSEHSGSTPKAAQPKAVAAKTVAAKAQPKPVAEPVKAQAAKTPVTRPATKPAGKPMRPNLMGGGLIDAGLVASSAANVLLMRRKGRDQMTGPSGIEQIKSDLNKSHSSIAADVLGQHADASGSRQPNLPNAGPRGNQSVHNQTFGSDASKAFVPRRTAG